MASFDSAWCLAELNALCSRPTFDEVPDATKYRYLATAQQNVLADIASRAPWVFYGPPYACYTADSKVFTFGLDDNGYAVFPLGKVKLYPSLSSIPDYALREGIDYLNEGTQVRIPNNGTYSGTLYWRGIPPIGQLSASLEPVLMPPPARSLIVLDAAIRFQRDNAQSYQGLQADYARSFAAWMLVYKTQFKSGLALASVGTSGASSSSGTASGYVWPVPFAVSLAPSTITINEFTTTTLVATVTNAGGITLPTEAVTFTSLTPTLADVSSSGVVTGLLSGTATIQAAVTSDPTITATTTVTVLLVNPQVVYDGDSLVQENSASDAAHRIPNIVNASLGVPWSFVNDGVGGQTTINMLDDAETQIDILYDATRSENILSCNGMTNDIALGAASAETAILRQLLYHARRRIAGWKIIAWTMLDYVTIPTGDPTANNNFRAKRNQINTALRAIATSFDGLFDWASIALLGVDNAENLNPSYFFDNAHPNDAGYALAAPLMTAAVRSTIGVTRTTPALRYTTAASNCTIAIDPLYGDYKTAASIHLARRQGSALYGGSLTANVNGPTITGSGALTEWTPSGAQFLDCGRDLLAYTCGATTSPNGFTFGALIRIGGGDVNQIRNIWDGGGGGAAFLSCYQYNGHLAVDFSYNNAASVTDNYLSTATMSAGRHLVMVSFDKTAVRGSRLIVYLDGVAIPGSYTTAGGTIAFPSTISSGLSFPTVSAGTTPLAGNQGLLGFNKVLSSSEHAALAAEVVAGGWTG